METLPCELLEKIFEFSCTDGGRTGCSLSLVSKRFRDVSSGMRFDTVALCSGSATQLSSFRSTYTAAYTNPVAATPRLRHLCITNPKGLTDPRDSSLFLNELTALLRVVSPYLQSLAYISTNPRYGVCLLDGRFGVWSALRELIVVGRGVTVPGSELHRRLTETGGPERFPRLKHLHLFNPRDRLEQWAKHIPRLTHLRVSGADNVTTFAAQLKQAVCSGTQSESGGSAGPGAAAAPPPQRLFPRLQHLIIHPYRIVNKSGERGMNHREQSALKSVQLTFKEILECENRPRVGMQPTMGVDSVHELGCIVVKEWLGGGFVDWDRCRG